MDNYLKTKCIQGLIIGMDEQMFQISQAGNHGLSEVERDRIAKYFIDAIKEQLAEEDTKVIDPKYSFVIKVNGITHAHYAKTIGFDDIVFFTNLKCRKEDLTITYSGEKYGGTLRPNVEIEVYNNMVFNAVMTNKA